MDSSVILNSIELLTENPVTLVMGGSELLILILLKNFVKKLMNV